MVKNTNRMCLLCTTQAKSQDNQYFPPRTKNIGVVVLFVLYASFTLIAGRTVFDGGGGHSQHRFEALEERAEGGVDAARLPLPFAARLDLGAPVALAAGEIDDPQGALLASTLQCGLVRKRT